MLWIKLKDYACWQVAGAPDPAFYDRWMKDNWLEVLGFEGRKQIIVRDPSDPTGTFSIFHRYVDDVLTHHGYTKGGLIVQ